MSFLKPSNASEAADLMITMTGFVLGLAALMFASKVMETFFEGSVASVLDYVQLACAGIVLLGYMPFMISMKSRFGLSVNPWKSESFLASSMRKAAWTTVGVLLLSLTLLSTLDNLVLSQISSEVAVDVVLFILFISLCVSFFIFSNDQGFE